ncbi:UMP kinase [Eubacteriales bacterium OttesenSCG-928-K08]|nr:UMP kinase [Eubacteriales bacterium OttesenSCG-928-K08]
MYKRVLLKLSGEALKSEQDVLDIDMLKVIAEQLIRLSKLEVEVGVVLGGGNIWRGRKTNEMDKSRADHMGMLATAINSIALSDVLLNMGAKCTVLSAVEMPRFCDTYTSRGAQKLLKEGHILIFACGSGHPYFTTDTAAALRAAEIEADALLLAKHVDGVYSADPNDPNLTQAPVLYPQLTFQQVIDQDLKATDLTAITLCKEQNIPILVFGLNNPENIVRVVSGEKIGTLISSQS